MLQVTRLDESGEYREAREALRVAELELMRRRERVAEMRRALPAGPALPDHVLTEGPRDLDAGDEPTPVRLADVFTSDKRPLLVYQLMFGGAQKRACPMCSMWVDGLNAVVPHIERNADFAVIAAAELADLRGLARERGWGNARLLSAAGTTLKHDLGSEDEEGAQFPRISVFTREDGVVRHHYSAGAQLDDDVRERGLDLLSPVWHALDLTPGGRGEWYPSLRYEEAVA